MDLRYFQIFISGKEMKKSFFKSLEFQNFDFFGTVSL